jgi:Reverse transcriptase (RNA-dependent DNA polymerase)
LGRILSCHTAIDIPELQGDTPYTRITGDTCDISHLCEFSWFDRVWWVDPLDKSENRKLGRYLGPSHDIGQAMCSRILTQNGTEISRTSVVPLTTDDKNNEVIKNKMAEFDDKLKSSLGDRIAGIPLDDIDQDIQEFEPYENYEDDDPTPRVPDADEHDIDSYHNFIQGKVNIPQGGQAVSGRVIGRKRDQDGNLIGKSNRNTLLDTSLYDVQFEDGHVEAFSANVIAENLYEQMDSEGKSHRMIDEIIDHKKMADAINTHEAYKVDGKKRNTTKGWKICVPWRDGSMTWERMVEIKEGYLVELAEYVVANQLQGEPAFEWWVPQVLKRKEQLIAQVKTRYLRKDEKFGIPLPKSVREALQYDQESESTYWADAIKKEMAVILPAVRILPPDQRVPVGYQEIPCHMIFDIKSDFQRKARFVGGGHVTAPPTSQTYASVVSRESVRIAFLYASLNQLNVLSADIQGAYLNAPCKERVFTTCGPEFGADMVGRKAIIEKALYGLKSSAFAWREDLAKTLETDLEFTHCLADNDVWMRPATKQNGDEYYQYVLVHTDDLLVIAEDPAAILNLLDQHYVLKPGSIGEPTTYLGAEIGKYHLPNRPERPVWYMSSDKYCKEAVRNVKRWLEERGRVLKSKAPSVFPSGYRAELDTTNYCNDDESNYFQQQICVLRWLVELGRIDIAAEVSMLASYTVAPRRGQFDTMLHIYAYLTQHNRSKLVFDDLYVPIDDEEKTDWSSFYPEAKELIPDNMPTPRGNPVQQIVFVDADHAADVDTRRSRTGVLFYLNRSPILWYTKRQNSVETSTFGSEFMATKTAVELIKAMRYKLRMLAIPLDGHAHLRVDNMSVVANTTVPASTLKKKSNSIAYHFTRESVAADILRIAYETSKSNKADILTKTHTGPERERLASGILF